MLDSLERICADVKQPGTIEFLSQLRENSNRWVNDAYGNHVVPAQRNAYNNASSFLRILALEVARLEESGRLLLTMIQTALNNPDFSRLIQSGLINTARSDEEIKHLLLARVIAERIAQPTTSMHAATSRMAVEVLPNITHNQLLITGLLVNIWYLEPNAISDQEDALDWLNTRIEAFMQTKLSQTNYLHLEALGCLKMESVFSHDLFDLMDKRFGFEYEEFTGSDAGKKIIEMWERAELRKCSLTTVGQLFGVMINDSVLNEFTDLNFL